MTSAALLSCKNQEEPTPTLKIPKQTYSVDASGGMIDVFFQSDVVVDINFVPEVNWLDRVDTKASTLNIVSFQCQPNETLQERNAKIVFGVSGSSVSQTVEVTQTASRDPEPKILSFSFLAKDNPDKLLTDVKATVNEDGAISAVIPYILVDKKLIPSIEFSGKELKLQTEGALDFARPVVYAVANSSAQSKEYTVTVNSFTGLPVVTIETEKRYINPDKNIYVNGSVKIDGLADFSPLDVTTRLKGRGNATWNYPKKPYRLKLDKKNSLLGMPEDKDWVLLAGYCDKSLIRLDIFFEISRLLEMAWTPRMHYVELFLNGRYEGNYMLGEHVKTAAHRLNVDEDHGGMLIEIDNYYSAEPIWFVSSQNLPFTFKTPDPDEITDLQLSYAKQTIDDFEKALYGNNFKDPQLGYRSHIDINSFACWYLINNICKNTDTNFYFYKTNTESTLQMGPVWDAEWCFGLGWDNEAPSSAEGFVIQQYFGRLWQDEYFRETVRTIWNANKAEIKQTVLQRINDDYEKLLLSQEANFSRWNILNDYLSVGYVALATYNNEVQYVKNFFLKRMDWLDTQFNQ